MRSAPWARPAAARCGLPAPCRDARADKLPGLVTGVTAPPLPGMTEVEETAADLWATGLTPGRHPTEFVRERLTDRGVVTVEALRELPHRTVVEVAGIVTHRQQPDTAKGVVFVNLEDETGLLNVICTADVWRRFRKVARMSPALIVRGMLERYQGVDQRRRRPHRGAPAHRRRHGPLPRLPLVGFRRSPVVRIDW